MKEFEIYLENRINQLEAKLNKYQETELNHASFSEKYIQDLEQSINEIFEKYDKRISELESAKCFACRESERRNDENLKWEISAQPILASNNSEPKERVEMPSFGEGGYFSSNSLCLDGMMFFDPDFKVRISPDEFDEININILCNPRYGCGKDTDFNFTKEQFQQLINDMQQLLDDNK